MRMLGPPSSNFRVGPKKGNLFLSRPPSMQVQNCSDEGMHIV